MAKEKKYTSNAASPYSAYSPLENYGFISDCHSSALVSQTGSIDWCCMPRFDSRAVFARLLDNERGGAFSITPTDEFSSTRQYIENTLVLETVFTTKTGTVRLRDCLTMCEGGRLSPRKQLLRIVDGLSGWVDLSVHIAPRLDFGAIRPWIQSLRGHNCPCFSVIGGADGFLITGLPTLEKDGRHNLVASFRLQAGEKARVSCMYCQPEIIDAQHYTLPEIEELDVMLVETTDWWQRWAQRGHADGPRPDLAMRSACILKGLTNAPTGAIAAAATTSLPESLEGDRNWDYRFSWVRDAVFSVRALVALGFEREADGFRRFIERSAAGSAEDLQIMYGLGGERSLPEIHITTLEGWRRHGPVRVGNAASRQKQHDLYGELLDLAHRWHDIGHCPDDDYWEFLCETIEAAIQNWHKPDRGIWEIRGPVRHFVHSKAACWSALNSAISLAHRLSRPAPFDQWGEIRHTIRNDVEKHGYDTARGVFVQSYDNTQMDAALLLLPIIGFVDHMDPRMLRTVDCIMDELMEDGLLLRYRQTGDSSNTGDGLTGREGYFLACTFWLVECLACQGRREEALALFERTVDVGNDLGLFAEEYDPSRHCMVGNFPQGLTHLSLVTANASLDKSSTCRKRTFQQKNDK
ncbi:glycoside hydrolase family 15 protein [Desulfovibrio inopinatus]|uniref:glycoside hydrolase family 15 protein n=1 Tax=Desulfovibrio inopinatus TaxID=102109 RepID=UPI00040FE11D|nr:glycoside hydrolase family 15 protein [Desulfovibrio inopinatus]